MIERRQTYYSDQDSNPHTLNTITRLPRAFVPAKGTRQQTSVMFIILPMNPEVHMSRPSLISERSPHSTREGFELSSARWSTSKQLDYKCTPLHSAGVRTSVLGLRPAREGNPELCHCSQSLRAQACHCSYSQSLRYHHLSQSKFK